MSGTKFSSGTRESLKDALAICICRYGIKYQEISRVLLTTIAMVFHGGKNQLYLSLPTGSAPTPKNVLQRKLPSSLLRCFSIKYRVAKGPMAHYRPTNQPSCISLHLAMGIRCDFHRIFNQIYRPSSSTLERK